MKRSLTAPLVGLGLGATALGGAAYVGGGARCVEGRVVDSLAQCQSIVGLAGAPACAAAFGAFSPAAEQVSLSGAAPPAVADRAVFLTTRPNGEPAAAPVTRAAGDPKWRNSAGAIMEPFRNSCARGGSSSSGGGARSGWSGWGGGSGVNSSATVARSGFGSIGRAFSFSSGG